MEAHGSFHGIYPWKLQLMEAMESSTNVHGNKSTSTNFHGNFHGRKSTADFHGNFHGS